MRSALIEVRGRCEGLGNVSVINIETRFRGGAHPPLTERERRVLTELALGSSTEEAAASIQLSPHTVRSHVKSALRKLGAQTRSHAVAIAIAQGEIDVAAALLRA